MTTSDHSASPVRDGPTGVIRMYQNGNTVDVQMPTFNEASELFHRLAHLTDIPDVHFSVWQASRDRDLAAERRVER